MSYNKKIRMIDQKLIDLGVNLNYYKPFLKTRKWAYFLWIFFGILFALDCSYYTSKSRLYRMMIVNILTQLSLWGSVLFESVFVGVIFLIPWLFLWLYNGLTIERDLTKEIFEDKLSIYLYLRGNQLESSYNFKGMIEMEEELINEGLIKKMNQYQKRIAKIKKKIE